MRSELAVVLAALLAVGACASSSGSTTGEMEPADAGPKPVFPDGVEGQWIEARDCRHSHEHELNHIRVFASPEALDSYRALSPDVPYPVGAVLVKVEYNDANCSERIGYTAMRKERLDTSDGGSRGWYWQKLDSDRRVIEDGTPRGCIQCHEHHCAPPFGFDLTCAEEL